MDRRWASTFLERTTWELIMIFIPAVVGNLYVRADKAFAMQLDDVRPNLNSSSLEFIP